MIALKTRGLPYLAALALTILSPVTLKAELRDTLNTGIREYLDELGYFQKANRDLGDPRFMFSDSKGLINFGIGGTAKVSAYMGFGGTINDDHFLPSLITIPTDASTPTYGTYVGNTELHFKARSSWKGHKMISYVKLKSNGSKSINLNQAYISFDGFSLGLIPSFFMDLEVGVMGSDLALCNQLDIGHTLFGYTFRFGKGWEAAAALEAAEFDIPDDRELGLGDNYQPVPDIVAHCKYRWDKGHVQLGAIFRTLTYWAFDKPDALQNEGLNVSIPGYGFSLSGNIRPNSRLKLSYEFVGGKGIEHYLGNLSGMNLDVTLLSDKKDGYSVLAAVPVVSGLVAAQYNWTEKMSSSIILGGSKIFQQNGAVNYNNYDGSLQVSANFFWYLNDWLYSGIEFNYGRKWIYADESGYDHGRAFRLSYTMAYCF